MVVTEIVNFHLVALARQRKCVIAPEITERTWNGCW